MTAPDPAAAVPPPSDQHVEGRITSARSIRSPDEAVDVYRSWATHYDDDVFGTLGFTGTDRIADLLAEHVTARDGPVIDLGCGTGAAGGRLHRHGFRTIDGVDISPEMLAIAEVKRVYRRLVVGDLLDRLPLADATYDAAVSAGTFTSGHVGPAAIPEIVRVLRPRALVAWVIALAIWPSFEGAIAAAGIEVLHRSPEPIRRGGAPEAMMLVGRLGGPAATTAPENARPG